MWLEPANINDVLHPLRLSLSASLPPGAISEWVRDSGGLADSGELLDGCSRWKSVFWYLPPPDWLQIIDF